MRGSLLFPLFLGFFLLTTSGSRAQDMEITPVPMQFRQNPTLITGMAQDTRGFIWIADDRGGLFRFDGSELTQFKNDPNNPNSLSANRLECVSAASDGSLWIGTFSSGLIHFDPQKDSYVSYRYDSTDPSGIRSDHIRALWVDSSGGVWIGTREGVDYYDPKTQTFEHRFTEDPDEQALQGEHVRSLYLDRQGIVWVGAGSPFQGEDRETEGGLFRIDLKSKSVDHYTHSSDPSSLIDNRVRAIFEDSRGTFWIGTAGDGLHTLDRETGIFTRHRYDPARPEKLSRPPLGEVIDYTDDHITFIQEDIQGFIWIGTMENGINRYDPYTQKVRHFGQQEEGVNRLPRDDYWCALAARDGLMWIGGWLTRSPNDQLLRVNPGTSKISPVLMGMPLATFAEDDSKNIFLGSSNLILRKTPEGIVDTFLQLEKYFVERLCCIRNLELDAERNLWISSDNGLFCYNLNTRDFKVYQENEKNRLESSLVTETHKLNKDSIWVLAGSELYLLDLHNDLFTKVFSPDGELEPFGSTRIFVDSQERTWLSGRKGIMRVKWPSRQTVYYSFSSLDTKSVFDLCETPSGDIYIGTWKRGLRKYNPDKDQFDVVEDMTGLINENITIFSIYSESEDRLWLESEDGIILYNPITRHSSIYGKDWGYVGTSRTRPGFFRSSDGEYYLGNLTGYLKFDPEDLREQNQFRASVFIDRALVDNQQLSWDGGSDEEVKLAFSQNNLSFELGFINFLTNPFNHMLKYSLEGFGDKWKNGRSGERVNYYNLPPGTYEFRLRGMDYFGHWEEASIPFIISPPWYKTWWAYTTYALALITGIFFFDRTTRQRIKKREREKMKDRELAQAKEIEKAYQDLALAHDNLKSAQAQLIQQEKLASLGQLTAGIAHEIKNPLNFVNNFSEISQELLEEMREEIEKGDWEEVKDIARNLEEVLEKIHQHGSRADGIVKSMLLHSRGGSGQMEPTDLNALVREYVNLAFHGMRAGKEPINVSIDLQLDEKVGKVPLIAEDFSRVLLNLCNNAFDAMRDKLRADPGNGYQPRLEVATGKEKGLIILEISDNGPGIPEEFRDKILQPFFTTKKGKEGTGLGLSISNDIVKAHGGKMKVSSVEGTGTQFAISLNQ
jgi:signal transduction histidine kinase/ligand-binding sensor domain-containing protein